MATPQGCQVDTESPVSSVGPITGIAVQHRRDRKRMDRPPTRGGHECEFIHPPLNFQTECSVCLLVLRSPHITNCCGNNFCKECIERVQEEGKCCPLCNKDNFTLTYNRAHDVSLQQFDVYCTHRKMGCEWRGKLEMLDTHLNVNPESERQVEGCDFVEVQCYHDGCEKYLQRRFITRHQTEDCSMRPYSCDYCHDYSSTKDDVLFNHWPVCRCYPVSCPNYCTDYAIERQNLEQHLKEECPLQEVECEFKYTGCEAKLPRKDMPGHLTKDNVRHMTLLAQQNQTLARENKELMTKLLEKDEQNRKMIEDGQRVMVDSISRLEDSPTKHQQKLSQNTETLARQNEELKAELLQKDEQLRMTVEDSIARLTKQQQENTATITRQVEDSIARLTKQQQENTATLTRQNEEATAKLRQLEEHVEAVEGQVEAQANELRREMNRIEEERSVQAKRSSADMQEVQKTVVEIKEGQNAMNAVSMGPLHGHIPEIQLKTAPVQIVMTNYGQHKRDGDQWYSDGFYTHPQGYKMCMRVYANGEGSGKGTHMTCYIYLMPGDFDNHLKWPFRGDVTITLLNQREDNNHHTKTVDFDKEIPDECTARVTSGKRAGKGIGYDFIPHSQFGYNPATNCQYLVNDCLYFRVKFELR